MIEIGVIGLGNWGTALANHLAKKGHSVLGWTIDTNIQQGIEEHRHNPSYQSQTELSENLEVTQDLEEVLKRKFLVYALPSATLQEFTPKLVALPAETLLVSAVKGIESDSVQTPLQYFSSQGVGCLTGVLSGPSFAVDVIRGRPVGIVAAASQESVAKRIAEIFQSDSMKVYFSDDPVGVELGGILKNVIALAAGVGDGLQLGDSARAGIITRGLAEISRLAVALGARPETLSGLSGMGDLFMTASCDTSRNRTVGLRLGAGESLNKIIESLGSVAEGVRTTPLVLRLARDHNIEIPITEQVGLLLDGKTTPEQMVEALLARPICKE